MGKLGLDTSRGQNYCMGGPGIIFNNQALIRMKPHIKSCLKSLQTSHEDVELGRCFFKKLNLSCTNNLEMKQIFRHYSRNITEEILGKDGQSIHHSFSLFSKFLTMHPLKSRKDMLKVYMLALKYQRQIQNYRNANVSISKANAGDNQQ